MVYDVPRNFIGDMHWTGEEDMQEGDEVLLEKAGVKVEVAERIGQTQTDLSELRAKKGPETNVEPRRRVERTDLRTATPVPRAISGGVARGNTQLKHKSLNALLGTPKGQMGKAALPTKSPFEERHSNVENEQWEDGRPAKKARTAETRTSEKSTKQGNVPLWARTADSKADHSLQKSAGQVFIDLSDDVTPSHDFLPGFSSDALAPSSPVRAAARDVSGSSSSPAFQTRQPPEPGRAPSKDKTRGSRIEQLDQEPQREANAPIRPASKLRKSPQPARQPSPEVSRPSSIKPGQTLRLAASAPKKRMLLCQDQLTRKPQTRTAAESATVSKDTIDDEGNCNRPKTAKERVAERVKQVNKRKARSSTAGPDSTTNSNSIPIPTDIENDSGMAAHRNAPTDDCSRVIPRNLTRPDEAVPVRNENASGARAASEHLGQRSSHEVSAIELARLDRMMLPPAAPRRVPSPPVQIPSPREARPLRRVISEPPNKPIQAKPGSKRVPGAPVRYTPTPSPTKRSRESTPIVQAEKEVRAPFKTKPKKTLQKSVSLNMTAAGTSTVILGRPFQAPTKPQVAKAKKPDPPPEDVGPWSREAFDLFKWRPPGWDEEKWCVVETVEAAGKTATTTAPAGLSGGAGLPAVLEGDDKG